ncbi:restriction endonuclease subunit S [Ligilactobacillus salivarius]|uniref:restriction endonuclease subunit S n=1 Tax=Ligilactobacillus salivarius TaxID=1624 RepID=UPI0015D7BE67|nr:restriction endonuclease subunit S [Ligilactobacillus salivarius]
MDNKKNGIPKLRFPGFTGAWEQRKLGEVATFSKGTGYSKQDLENDGTPIILYGRMYTNYELVIHSVNTFTTAKEKSIYSNGGEVIVPASGETAEDISVASVVEQANVLLGGDLNIIHTNKNVEPVFLALSITNGEPHKDMAKRAQGKSVVHLHNSDLAQIKLSYPSKDEQKKIDSYFLKFDSLIALHQRKLEHLQEQKKGLLQKMFPKNGEVVPEVRFPGFTDAWEQRKLGEVTEINPSSEIPDNFEYVDLESVVGTEMIAYRRENKETAPSRAQRLAKKGDIFYQTVRPYQKNNYHFNLMRKDFVFSTGYAQLRPNINGDFLFVYIQLNNFVNEVLNRSTGTSYPAISPSNLMKIKIAIPTNSEQEKIGKFFKQLDSLITLHQRKLEHLELMKKGLLQQMFV